MRIEYRKLFKGKYYWEYDRHKEKERQSLVSLKYNDTYEYWLSLSGNKEFPIEIIDQFKRDVDDHYADIEKREDERRDNLMAHIAARYSDEDASIILRNWEPVLLPHEILKKHKPTEKPLMSLKLEIYEPKKEKQEEKKLQLRLDTDGSGNVGLMTVDKDGNNKYCILTITPHGNLRRLQHLGGELGLKLDKFSRIIEVD